MSKDQWHSGDGIGSIRLEGALPHVFLDDGRNHGSEVWLSNLQICRGDFVIIAAESGTGKSSLCSYIYGARRDYEGRISFNSIDIATFTRNDWQLLRRTNIAYLTQDLGLFPELTARQNIELKNQLTGYATAAKIDEWIAMLGIADRADYPVGRMSVGQQQRVGIIRALCQPFDFIILDEPVSHLDEANNRIAATLIADEARRQGAGVIATSVGNHLSLSGARMLRL